MASFTMNIESLREVHTDLIMSLGRVYERNIALKKGRIINGIVGQRGVGKTTFILHYLCQHYGSDNEKALYVSADNIFFAETSLYELATAFYREGGKLLCIDEIHRYAN